MSTNELNDTGIFFGEIEGEVMLKLVDEGFFRKIEIYDYQGLCIEEVAVSSIASFTSKVSTLCTGKCLINAVLIHIKFSAPANAPRIH